MSIVLPVEEVTMSRVEEMMSRHVLTVTAGQTLEEGAQAMFERKTGSAVVVKQSRFIGIVTERDVLRAVAHGRIPWSTRIVDVMTADPVSITPDTLTADAIRVMIEGGFRHLPISRDGRTLVGLVSLRELLKATALPKFGVTIVPDGGPGLSKA
ncbi:MAG: CBS domain-containing protein [Actinomycetota bacterium]